MRSPCWLCWVNDPASTKKTDQQINSCKYALSALKEHASVIPPKTINTECPAFFLQLFLEYVSRSVQVFVVFIFLSVEKPLWIGDYAENQWS